MSYANLFDACPPFQIDANFGTPAAIAEMLVQSENSAIHLLPALPDAWKNGTVSGLCARGGFEVSLTWKNGRLVTAKILSKNGGSCRINYENEKAAFEIKKGTNIKLDGNLNQI